MDISVDRSPCEVCEYKMNDCEPMTATSFAYSAASVSALSHGTN